MCMRGLDSHLAKYEMQKEMPGQAELGPACLTDSQGTGTTVARKELRFLQVSVPQHGLAGSPASFQCSEHSTDPGVLEGARPFFCEHGLVHGRF